MWFNVLQQLADFLEENKALTIMQANHELEINELKVALAKERENLVNTTQKLQGIVCEIWWFNVLPHFNYTLLYDHLLFIGNQKLNESSQKELHELKMDKDKASSK